MCSKESTKESTKLKQEERDYIILEWVLLNGRDWIELTAIMSSTHTLKLDTGAHPGVLPLSLMDGLKCRIGSGVPSTTEFVGHLLG